MATYEDRIRRELEVAAACPVEEDVDAALGFREYKKELRGEMPKSYNKKIGIKRARARGYPKGGIRIETKKKHGT